MAVFPEWGFRSCLIFVACSCFGFTYWTLPGFKKGWLSNGGNYDRMVVENSSASVLLRHRKEPVTGDNQSLSTPASTSGPFEPILGNKSLGIKASKTFRKNPSFRKVNGPSTWIYSRERQMHLAAETGPFNHAFDDVSNAFDDVYYYEGPQVDGFRRFPVVKGFRKGNTRSVKERKPEWMKYRVCTQRRGAFRYRGAHMIMRD